MFPFVLLVMLFVQDTCAVPMYRRMPNAQFTNISRAAFKKLNSEIWQGSKLTGNEEKWFKTLTNPGDDRRLNSTKLKELLGEYDSRYMSETKPSRAWLNTKNQVDRRNEFEAFKHGQGIKNSVAKLLNKKRIRLNEVEFEDIRFWLWNLTRCTAEPLWKDFGTRVWPRYVNIGKCSNKVTCSIPTGMRCQPSEKKSVRLLYWICPRDARRCFWSFFDINIIRACRCSC
ncbi:noggin-like [Dendronephthya gigantea]|uniref:noggin-like n=1 Tax=Dendronephthya gigantea TaxID=151771 RepID=UPI00106D13FB|nr:noggin-like [Dendronephthya gigantea]